MYEKCEVHFFFKIFLAYYFLSINIAINYKKGEYK